MKISVIMIDGSFRENVFGAKYFSEQDFPEKDYEVIWVEYYNHANEEVYKYNKVRVITLNREGMYHSSYCFNRGIVEARGELLVIPDADQIVRPDFLNKVWSIHEEYEKLVVYGYRYDELEKGVLNSFSFDELDRKTVLKNPLNYGGCLTVRKKWLLKINGYEQHPLFGSGNHANGLDIYTRFKNLGLAIMWSPELKLYHPWHPFTLMYTKEHEIQKRIIEWRRKKLEYLAIEGIDRARNLELKTDLEKLIKDAYNELNELERKKMIERKFFQAFDKAMEYKKKENALWKNKLEEALNILKESKIESVIFKYRIGSILKTLGRVDKAEKVFIDLEKNYRKGELKAGIYFHLGEIYFIKGKRELSKEFFNKVLKINPDHEKAKKYLKQLGAKI